MATLRLACYASFAEEIAGKQKCDNRFFAARRRNRNLNRAALKVEDGTTLFVLGKNILTIAVSYDLLPYTGGCQMMPEQNRVAKGHDGIMEPRMHQLSQALSTIGEIEDTLINRYFPEKPIFPEAV